MDKEKFTMKRASLLVSLNCNLKCKLCTVGSPYYSGSKFPELSELEGQIHALFEVVDLVEIFTISGGEPLLYKQLPQLLESLLKYSDHFEKIEIITNGTIIPTEELLEAVKKYGDKFLRFIVDDYGNTLSKKASHIASLLDENNIPYRLNDYCSDDLRFGGWVDHGPMTDIVNTKIEARKLFAKCAQPQKMGFCFLYVDGCLYPCSVVFRRFKLGQSVDEKDYVNIIDQSLTTDEKRKKISDIYNTDCLESCEYCTYALSDDAPRFPPAVQMTAEELKETRVHGI